MVRGDLLVEPEAGRHLGLLLVVVGHGFASVASVASGCGLCCAAACGSVVLTGLLLAFIAVRRRRRDESEPGAERQDQNPIYGLYYFGDGDKIDGDTAEVTDENTYYGC